LSTDPLPRLTWQGGVGKVLNNSTNLPLHCLSSRLRIPQPMLSSSWRLFYCARSSVIFLGLIASSRARRPACCRSFSYPPCCHEKVVFAALMLLQRYPYGMLFLRSMQRAVFWPSHGITGLAHSRQPRLAGSSTAFRPCG
jgi:hypothetical protein